MAFALKADFQATRHTLHFTAVTSPCQGPRDARVTSDERAAPSRSRRELATREGEHVMLAANGRAKHRAKGSRSSYASPRRRQRRQAALRRVGADDEMRSALPALRFARGACEARRAR